MKKIIPILLVVLLLVCGLAISPLLLLDTAAANGPIEQVDPATLTCDGLITFEDVAGGPAPGTNYDVVFESGNASFAERFVGQTLTIVGDFDQLSGSPTSPLTMQIGNPNQNLNIYSGIDTGGAPALTGLGHLGFPNYDAIGEGSFAVLFDFDQSEFGFALVGGGGGSATVNFFKRDGTLIDTIVLTGLPSGQAYGFKRAGGVNDIAGISIHNDDPAGIGILGICHDVPGVPGRVVEIDIKPGSDPNSINLKGNGVIPVAILTTAAFDATEVDVTTVELEGIAPVKYELLDVPEIWNPALGMYEGDGDLDLLLYFKTRDMAPVLDMSSTEATLTGETLAGMSIQGTDSVRIVKE